MSTSSPLVPSPSVPAACGEPDPCGLAPAGVSRVDRPARPTSMGRVTRLRAGLVRRGTVMRHLASEVGQGTVEYVGLLLLMATLLAAIVGGVTQMGGKEKIGQKVVNQISDSIDKVESKGK